MPGMTSQFATQSITGLILAGGRGLRMGGQDKGLVEYQGRPLVMWTLDRLAPQVSGVLISANRNQAIYSTLGYPVVTDYLPDYPGPLAGLHACLLACSTPLLACVPCDTPHFPMGLVSQLVKTMELQQVPASWAITNKGEHPVFLVCKRELATQLANYLNQGGRRVREWLKQAGAVPTMFPFENEFANFNTTDELKELRGHQ